MRKKSSESNGVFILLFEKCHCKGGKMPIPNIQQEELIIIDDNLRFGKMICPLSLEKRTIAGKVLVRKFFLL